MAGQGKGPRLGDQGLLCAGLRMSSTLWLPRAQRHQSCPSHVQGPAWNTSDRARSVLPTRRYWRGLKSTFHESFFFPVSPRQAEGCPGHNSGFGHAVSHDGFCVAPTHLHSSCFTEMNEPIANLLRKASHRTGQ